MSELYDEYAPAIFAYLGMALDDRAAAEELLVEVFRLAASQGSDDPADLLGIARDRVAAHPLSCPARMRDVETGLAVAGARRRPGAGALVLEP